MASICMRAILHTKAHKQHCVPCGGSNNFQQNIQIAYKVHERHCDGDSIKRTPENASKLFAADSILDTGAKIYCLEVRAEGYRTLKRNAQQTFDNQMDDLVKQSNDMWPTCLFNCDNQ